MGVIFLCTCWGGWFYAAIKRWPHVEWPLVGIRLAEVWLHWTNFSLDSFILHPGAKTNKENEKKHNLKSIVIQFLFHKHLDGRSFLEGSVPTNPFNKSRVWAAVFHRSRFDYERKSSSHDSLPARRFGGRFGKVQFAKKKKNRSRLRHVSGYNRFFPPSLLQQPHPPPPCPFKWTRPTCNVRSHAGNDEIGQGRKSGVEWKDRFNK